MPGGGADRRCGRGRRGEGVCPVWLPAVWEGRGRAVFLSLCFQSGGEALPLDGLIYPQRLPAAFSMLHRWCRCRGIRLEAGPFGFGSVVAAGRCRTSSLSEGRGRLRLWPGVLEVARSSAVVRPQRLGWRPGMCESRLGVVGPRPPGCGVRACVRALGEAWLRVALLCPWGLLPSGVCAGWV